MTIKGAFQLSLISVTDGNTSWYAHSMYFITPSYWDELHKFLSVLLDETHKFHNIPGLAVDIYHATKLAAMLVSQTADGALLVLIGVGIDKQMLA